MQLSVLRDLFRLAWPVLVAQIAIMANGVIDTIMAGRYGTIDLAAVGVGAAVYATTFIALMGVLLGLTPVAAQLHGAGRHAEVGEEVRQSVWLALALGTISVLLLIFPEPILAVSRLAPEVEAKVRAYLRAIAWGVPAALLFRVFYGFTTAIAFPRVVMALNLAGVALKLPLNAVFMYGYLGAPELGGPGCAVASAIIAWAVCVAGWVWCYAAARYRPYRVFARWSWPHWHALRHLLALGVPIGVTFLVDVTAFTFMALFIARLGAYASGSHQIAANLAAFMFMLPLALGNAAAILVGHAVGANRYDRARATGIVAIGLGMALAVLTSSVLALAGERIAALYTPDPEVHRRAAILLLFVAAYHLFDALQAIAVNVLRGYKRTFVPMVIYAVVLWGVGLGGGYTLGLTDLGLGRFGWPVPLGAPGFWAGAIAGVALAGTLVTAYFLWMSRRIVR